MNFARYIERLMKVVGATDGTTILLGVGLCCIALGLGVGVVSWVSVAMLHWKEYNTRRQRKWFSTRTESLREGSELFVAPAPKYMFGVYAGKLNSRNEKIFVGNGFRYKEYLVMPLHVLFECEGQVIIHPSSCKCSGVCEYYEVPQSAWVEVATDVVVCNVSLQAMGFTMLDLKLKSAPIGPITGPSQVRCHSVRPKQNTSLGFLKSDTSLDFGLVSYSGSTVPGMSGAVYVHGPHVVAMHCGGGAINYGMSASYIVRCIEKLQRPESYDVDFILKTLRKGARRNDVHVRFSGLDDVHLEIGGQYWFIDRDDYAQIASYEDVEHFFFDEEEIKARRVRRSRVPECETNPFLGSPSVSYHSLQDVGSLIKPQEPPIESVSETSSLMSESQTSSHQELDTSTQRLTAIETQLEQLLNRLNSTVPSVSKPANKSPQRLKSTVQSPTHSKSTRSSSNVPECLGKKVGENGLHTCLEASTKPVQPVLGRLRSMHQSEMPLDGTVAVIQELRRITNSWDASKPVSQDLWRQLLLQVTDDPLLRRSVLLLLGLPASKKSAPKKILSSS